MQPLPDDSNPFPFVSILQRWRRRWFALKQGELPGQYLLEYYTDDSCRKLKGVIDLDQCEQVDAGLFMERKFQHVFNVKTPRRTYYLAAATDDVMRYWVNCICNVCGLQDLSKAPPEENNSQAVVPAAAAPPLAQVKPSCKWLRSPLLSTPSLINSPPDFNVTANDSERTYQNKEFVQKVLSGCDTDNSQRFNTMQQPNRRLGNSSQFSTLPPAASRKTLAEEIPPPTATDENHDYYNEFSSPLSPPSVPRPPRPIPEKLQLNNDVVASNATETAEPSPALSTASGPYIPISECFSGSPLPIMRNGGGGGGGGSFSCYENNFAPLNSLSRSNHRLDHSKSPLNIGFLNLTEGPPQSPKLTSGGRGSSDDSESVFTDDELASSHSGSHAGGIGGIQEAQLRRASGLTDRRLRPSDSSIENENIGWTAVNRYSKVPDSEKKCLNSSDPPPRPPKRMNDIGPLDSSSCVTEDQYEFPRSHRNPNCNTMEEPGKVDGTGDGEEENVEPKPGRRSHFYTNAAPSQVGQVFRYDFTEDGAGEIPATTPPPPMINRNLKPKTTSLHVPSKSCDQIETPPPMIGSQGATAFGSFEAMKTPGARSMTSSTTNTLNRPVHPQGMNLYGKFVAEEDTGRPGHFQTRYLGLPTHTDDKLQYLDLDHTTGHQHPHSQHQQQSRPESIRSVGSASAHNIHVGLPATAAAGAGASQLSLSSMKHSISEHNAMGSGSGGGNNGPSAGASSSGRGIVYKTVDFVRTEAFNRTRQDAEMSRSNKEK